MIKACPFCGSTNVKLDGDFFPCVFCDDCNAYSPVGFSKEDAINKWNKTVEDREDAFKVELKKEAFITI